MEDTIARLCIAEDSLSGAVEEVPGVMRKSWSVITVYKDLGAADLTIIEHVRKEEWEALLPPAWKGLAKQVPSQTCEFLLFHFLTAH